MKLKGHIQVIFQIFRQDLRRLIHNPIAMIVLIGVLFLPSVYAWYTIAADWDPYERTDAIKVAVANDDQGAHNDLIGSLDAGAQIIDRLHDNHELGWVFTSEDEALQGVRSGEYFAAIVIPADFSADLLSVLDGSFTRPSVDYYVNEKLSAVAPKLTDAGADTLEDQINAQFVDTVSQTVIAMAQKSGREVADDATASKSRLVEGVSQIRRNVEAAQGVLTNLDPSFNDCDRAIEESQATLSLIGDDMPALTGELEEAQSRLGDIRSSLAQYTSELSSQAMSASTGLAQAASEAREGIAAVSASFTEAQAKVNAALSDSRRLLALNRSLIDELAPYAADHPLLAAALADLERDTDQLEQTVSALQALADSLSSAADQAHAAADEIDAAASQGADEIEQAAQAIQGQVLPQITSSLDSFSSALGTLRGVCVSLEPQLSSATNSLSQLKGTLDQARQGTALANSSLTQLSDSLKTAETDLTALTSSETMSQLVQFLGISPDEAGSFMAAPVELTTEVLYPIKNYGTGVAPFFTNLALWVAGFILVAILHLRVDPAGLPRFTVTEAYLGRWLTFMMLGVLQGLIVCVGDLVLGIQCANPLAFIFAGLVTVFVNVNIMYALVYTMRHIGRAIGVIVLIMQIPGSSGEYPVQMMPAFFQWIHPLLPFTYSIDAMRQAIGGMYGANYWIDLACLLPFLALALAFGLIVGRYAFNLNAMFDAELSKTDLLVTESGGPVHERFRLQSVIQALLDTQGFRDLLLERARRLKRLYPLLARIGWAAIIALPVMMLLMNFAVHADVDTKLVLLMLMVAGIIAVGVYLVIVEFVNYNLAHELELVDMDKERLRSTADARLSPAQVSTIEEDEEDEGR